MSWKENNLSGEFYFSLDDGPYAKEVLANVYDGVDRLGQDAWIWEAHLPAGEFLDLDMDGWHGSAPTELAAKEAAEGYLRRKGLFS